MVEQVQEVANVLGVSLGECQVDTRRQGVEQERSRKEEQKQNYDRQPIEWGKVKVEIESSKTREQFLCNECNKQFKRNDHLKRHKVNHTIDAEPRIRYPCTECEKIFSLAFELDVHINDTHLPSAEICSTSEDDTLEIKEWDPIEWGKLKVEIENSKNKENFACNACNSQFKRNDHLKRHMLIHTTEAERRNKFPCTECDKTFSLAFNLANHIQYMHQTNTQISSNFKYDFVDAKELELYTCANCPKTFKNHKQRNKHNLDIHSEVTFKCDKCDKQFSRKSYIYTHKIYKRCQGENNYLSLN